VCLPPRGLNVCAGCASSFSWAWCVPSCWVQVAPLAEAAVVQGQLSCPGQTPTVGTVLPGSRNRIILSAGTHTRDAPLLAVPCLEFVWAPPPLPLDGASYPPALWPCLSTLRPCCPSLAVLHWPGCALR
jgi:hypothetical protein